MADWQFIRTCTTRGRQYDVRYAWGGLVQWRRIEGVEPGARRSRPDRQVRSGRSAARPRLSGSHRASVEDRLDVDGAFRCAESPLRADLVLDDAGALRKRSDFSQLPFIDRAVAVGVAAHEGQLFASLNQVAGALAALALSIVSVSAIVLWWSRRASGVLGAPRALGRQRSAPAAVACIVVLGILLPLLGASLILVLLVERTILRRVPPLRDFLGLDSARELRVR